MFSFHREANTVKSTQFSVSQEIVERSPWDQYLPHSGDFVIFYPQE
jgi:hypothetical protein